MSELRELIEQIQKDQVNEFNWKPALATAAMAGALVTGTPHLSQAANQPKYNITQAEEKIDLEKLLHAIKQVESSGGIDKRDRYESGVDKQLRNRFDRLGNNIKQALKKYGFRRVATSYGPYQILASTAYDLGFTGAPEDLRDENLSKQYVLKLISNNINSPRTSKVEDVISAYNAGLGRIGTNPQYVRKVMKFYANGG